jgi:hypothetical protein
MAAMTHINASTVLLLLLACTCTSQSAIVISTRDGSLAQTDLAAESSPQATTDTPPDATFPLFSDDFGSGYEVKWLPPASGDGHVTDTQDGSNKTVTLDSTNNDFTRLRTNLDGSYFTNTDITASMRLRIEQAPSTTSKVRLDVRQSVDTENIFYAVGATIATDGSMTKLSIFKKVGDGTGNYTICMLKEGKFATPVAMNQWRTIKLRISGTTSVQLAAYFEESEMANFVDDCVHALTSTAGETVPNGTCLPNQIGLGIQVEQGVVASVDDVVVTAP